MDKEYNSIHPHWDSNYGLTLIAKLSLHSKFPEILAQGYQCFQELGKQPVIYCGDDLVGQQICCSVCVYHSCHVFNSILLFFLSYPMVN